MCTAPNACISFLCNILTRLLCTVHRLPIFALARSMNLPPLKFMRTHTLCRQSERWNRKPTKLSEINREVAQEKVNQSNKQTKIRNKNKNKIERKKCCVVICIISNIEPNQLAVHNLWLCGMLLRKLWWRRGAKRKKGWKKEGKVGKSKLLSSHAWLQKYNGFDSNRPN